MKFKYKGAQLKLELLIQSEGMDQRACPGPGHMKTPDPGENIMQVSACELSTKQAFIPLPHSMMQSAKEKLGERHEWYIPGPDIISGLPPRYLSLQEQTLGADYSEADSENGSFKSSTCFPAIFCLLFL